MNYNITKEFFDINIVWNIWAEREISTNFSLTVYVLNSRPTCDVTIFVKHSDARTKCHTVRLGFKIGHSNLLLSCMRKLPYDGLFMDQKQILSDRNS